jgi:putative nucleotidyltransferase with HDIG domain
MMNCPQHPVYHREGDVWNHTEMVCHRVKDEDEALHWAAILHDVGKPATTNDEFEAPRHSIVGQAMARDILSGLNMDYRIRERICTLVRYHMVPHNIMNYDNPILKVMQMSCKTSNKDLLALARADADGRFCDNHQEMDSVLDIFEETAKKMNCLTKPVSFHTDANRVSYFMNYQYDKYVEQYEAKGWDHPERQVIMMSGLPGSGKTHWAKQQGLPIISLDDIRKDLKIKPTENQGKVIQSAKKACRKMMGKDRPFIFDATNLTLNIRSNWIKLFRDYNARIEIVYIEPEFKTILKQNKERDNPVPEDIIRKLFKKMHFPDITECHSITYV